MQFNSGQNLHQFLTNSRSNSQKTNTKNSKIYNNAKIYNQSKSNINIINIENANKRFNLFSNLNSKQKEKINLTKFLKGDKNYYNNINLITEQNFDKKHDPNKLNLNLSYLSNLAKNGKGNSFKTLNYDRSSFVRIMKYFTIKSSNKPLKFDELSPVFIPIRNTLSNEHRKNNNLNINSDNIKDKINFYYYINSKEKVVQLFKDKKRKNKNSASNISHCSGGGGKNNSNNNNSNNNDSGNYNNSNKINNLNLINKNDQRNSMNKASDNNLTFSKNSNESEFTFKDKGSAVFNLESKKSNKENSNESSKNNNDNTHNNIINSEINLLAEKDNKKRKNNKQSLVNNNEVNRNSNSGNRLAISIEKINNKERCDNNDYNFKNKHKYNYNIIKNEEKKSNDDGNSPKFSNEKLSNNLISKENHYKNITKEKSSNLLDKILNNQNINKNIKLENDINSNKNMNTIDNNENNDNKNNLKNSYQFRIRKINLPSGINLASIQHNNKLLQNIINKKSKNKGILNSNKICVAQTEYKIMKGEKMIDDNKNLYNINEKKKKEKVNTNKK
jgi:hypothetical protein